MTAFFKLLQCRFLGFPLSSHYSINTYDSKVPFGMCNTSNPCFEEQRAAITFRMEGVCDFSCTNWNFQRYRHRILELGIGAHKSVFVSNFLLLKLNIYVHKK